MARTYAQIQDLCEQMLQDTSNATYDTTELGYWIEESLKEFTTYDSHIVGVIFQIESRLGTDVTGTTSSLTDTSKSQFVAADATEEKVVHNTTDNTFAVVLANSSTSVNTLSADIMGANECYRIYNKRCRNERQIYIGDVTDYLWIDSVEYPIGTKRNWKVYDEVLEIDVGYVADSNSTLDPPRNIDVLVRFAKPHRLCQLGTLAGAVNLSAGYVKGTKTIAVDGLGTSEIIEIGDEFHLANKRYVYTITTGVTLSSGGGDISFFPGLEDAAVNDDAITFTKSTLQPDHEEVFSKLVVARALISESNNYLGEVTAGGISIWEEFYKAGKIRRDEALAELRRITPPKTKHVYPRD